MKTYSHQNECFTCSEHHSALIVDGIGRWVKLEAGRAGIVGIVRRLLRSFCRYLIDSREPARGRARPMVSSRTSVTSHLDGALEIYHLAKTRFN